MLVNPAFLGPAVSAGSPLALAAVDTWIKPKLAKIAKDRKVKKLLFEHIIESKFNEYFDRAYQRQSYIRTLVFQNKPMLLEDLYLPLRVKQSQDSSSILIDSYKKELIPECRRVLLTDTAGMGKSTLLRYLFLSCLKENVGTPVFVELRQLSPSKTILDVIYDDLGAIDEGIDKDFILELLRQGDFVFFLDGYDEIPYAVRDEVSKQLQDFISKAGNNDFILSSRPEEALASFVDFRRFYIDPLSNIEAYSLLQRYDQGAGLSEQIIEKLQSPGYENVHEFLRNPLLVSLLYKAYQYENHIPLKKHIFYRQVYDALFHSHDFTKPGAFVRQKYSNLDVEEFHAVLRSLGFITMKSGEVEYNHDELLGHITKAKESLASSSFKEAELLTDLVSTVPLFVKDGEYFRWNHKSIQEYFAAQFICRDAKKQQGDILRLMASDKTFSRYTNVLDMCYDMDYNTFRDSVIYNFAVTLVEHWKTAYSYVDRQQIAEAEIDLRKSCLLNTNILLFPASFFSEDKISIYQQSKDAESIFYEVRKYLEALDIYKDKDFFGFSLKILYDGGCVCFLLDAKEKLQSLLFRKKNAIILSDVKKPLSVDELVALKISLSTVCEGDSPLMLNDDPSSPANASQHFAVINQVINMSLQIDIKACYLLIEEVEKSTSPEAQATILEGPG